MDEQKMVFVLSSHDLVGGQDAVFFVGIAPAGDDLDHAVEWAREKFQRDSMRVELCKLTELQQNRYQVDWSTVTEYRTRNDLWDHLAARTRIWFDSY